MRTLPPRPATRAERPAYQIGLDALRDHGPMTAEELVLWMNIHRRNVFIYIALWHAAGSIFFTWQRNDRGDKTRVCNFRTSPHQRDAAPPAPMSAAEKRRRYQRKHRAVIQAKKQRARGEYNMFSQLRLRGST